ncbi:hypothetical protein ACH5RR_003359 [Cinchona calisaya]|uniref:Thioglucosidase n=1 Tax=Cinchona calisaya TaxID=153742 RepID=A0ABD3AUR3_9GENT
MIIVFKDSSPKATKKFYYTREDFREFAELCFWEFGDHVKNWITLNEPWSSAFGGYSTGGYAHGRGASTPEHVKDAIPKRRCIVHAQAIVKKEILAQSPIWLHIICSLLMLKLSNYTEKTLRVKKGKLGLHWFHNGGSLFMILRKTKRLLNVPLISCSDGFFFFFFFFLNKLTICL